MTNDIRLIRERDFLAPLPALEFKVKATNDLSSLIKTKSGVMHAKTSGLRLIRLDEINEEKHQTYRQALANVYSTLSTEQDIRLLYILVGHSTGVELYFGVITENDADSHEAIKCLHSALEGQLPGINFGDEVNKDEVERLIESFNNCKHSGLMLGAPTGQEQDQNLDEQNFQSVDRLVRAMQSSMSTSATSNTAWQLTVVSQPLSRKNIRQLINSAIDLSSYLASLLKKNVQASNNANRTKSASYGTSESDGRNSGESDSRGNNESGTKGYSTGRSSQGSSSGSNSGESNSKTVGNSSSHTKSSGTTYSKSTTDNTSLSDTEGTTVGISTEITDKRAQYSLEHLEKHLLPRLNRGLSKGLFKSTVYFSAQNKTKYDQLKASLRATFQGSEGSMAPLEVYDLKEGTQGAYLNLPEVKIKPNPELLIFHSLDCDNNQGAGEWSELGSLITADELAIFASLPQRELQGIRCRKTVDFILDLPDVREDDRLGLGELIDRGRRFPNNPLVLARSDLNKHIFVTGVTGAGKTTTCINLLLQSKLPFLVIEPAKTEYRELVKHTDHNITYYRINGDVYDSLRINPFALIRKSQRIKSHAGFLKAVFAAVFPMEASMPMMIEAAILAAYEEKGWSIDDNEYIPGGDPFDPLSRAWPTMSDMIAQLDRLIPTYGLGKEFEEKYRGSLVSRLRSLSDGTLGRILDVPQSIDFYGLIEQRAVIELEELQGGEEKALIMALLLGAINETMRDIYEKRKDFRQLTLLEEAHRILARPEPGNRTAALAVESFADMIAEIRKYGCGLIIADQIPAKLIPDVIKNTHCKIVHRLFAEDDRRAVGESMMMNETQRNFLPNLRIGEAVVFCGGWHGSAHAAIHNLEAKMQDAPFDLNKFSVDQLWQERKRYYPNFCSLDWLSNQTNERETFARFVRETRQVQNQLLMCLPGKKISSPVPVADGAFKRLKTWLDTWECHATNRPKNHPEKTERGGEGEWPESPLAAAWMALLLDANPKVRADKKNVAPLCSSFESSDRQNIIQACDQLICGLQKSNSLEEFKALLNDLNNRELKLHLGYLENIKTI